MRPYRPRTRSLSIEFLQDSPHTPDSTTVFNASGCTTRRRERDGPRYICHYAIFKLSLPISPTFLDVTLLDQSQTPLNSSVSSFGDPSFGDGSELLFSMYSAITAEEDDEMVERWQKNADSIIIFVSPRVSLHTTACVNRISVGRLILCRCRCVARFISPGLEVKSSRYLQLLSSEHERTPG